MSNLLYIHTILLKLPVDYCKTSHITHLVLKYPKDFIKQVQSVLLLCTVCWFISSSTLSNTTTQYNLETDTFIWTFCNESHTVCKWSVFAVTLQKQINSTEVHLSILSDVYSYLHDIPMIEPVANLETKMSNSTVILALLHRCSVFHILNVKKMQETSE